jgi:hypothetical protein
LVDDHRRVEPRSIVGTGMLTDPERIETLQQEHERLERTWRERPKKRFGEVLSETPARQEDEDEDEPAKTAAGDDAEAEDEPAQDLPRVPPDPRMAKLHAMLASPPGTKR